MPKTKITSFDKEGVRGGRSLEAVLSEFGLEEGKEGVDNGNGNGNSNADEPETDTEPSGEERVLHLCRLSFTTPEKAKATGRLIRSRHWSRHRSRGAVVWDKILLEKTSGRCVSMVLQDSVASTRVLEVKQHQRYDGIKWNFGLDWFPGVDSGAGVGADRCPLEEIHLTGVRFRGNELTFLNSLSDGLARSNSNIDNNATNTNTTGHRPIGLRVLDLNACRFLHPDVQYPILFRGLRAACFGTLERLWMPKSPGMDDNRFEELFGEILLAGSGNGNSSDNDNDNGSSDSSSIRELGFSYNGCGWKGSRAVASFLEAPQSARLRVLYLNRQQGELDLRGILRASASGNESFRRSHSHNHCHNHNRNRGLHLNLSQNYVSGFETLSELQELSGSDDAASREDDGRLGLHVELDNMTFEVPEAVFPGNESNNIPHNSRANSNNNNSTNNTNSNANNAHGRGGVRGHTRIRNFEDHLQTLSQEEIAKLNVACGRVKYVLGRAVAASEKQSSSSSNNNNSNESTGSDWFFSSLAALDCVLPDLLTILRLHEKQNAPMPHENVTTNDPLVLPQQEQQQEQQHRQRQYRNWLPTFLRKAVKGKIELLKPWLLSVSQMPPPHGTISGDEETIHADDAVTAQTPHHERPGGVGRRPPVVVAAAEQERLTALWTEIEALHANIAHHAGQRRHKHSPGHPSGESSTKKKFSRRKKHGRKGIQEIPMTPRDNPLVKAAYEAIPVIPASILESSEGSSPFLSLPLEGNDETNPESPESNGGTEANGDEHEHEHDLPTVKPVPPLFIDTAEGLLKLRDDLFRRPPPHKLPKMVAVDSEWYFTEDTSASASTSAGEGVESQRKKNKNRSMSVATLQIAYVDENTSPSMKLRSFVIDLLSDQPGFQELAREYVSWLFGSASCDMMILGFAFGGDLRQLRKYAGIGGYRGHKTNHNNSNNHQPAHIDLASLESVESRCLDVQRLLASPEELRAGRVPGLKTCAQHYFQKPLKKDDQTSDWRERPLRPSQLEYAALDAVILLVILSQKKHADQRGKGVV